MYRFIHRRLFSTTTSVHRQRQTISTTTTTTTTTQRLFQTRKDSSVVPTATTTTTLEQKRSSSTTTTSMSPAPASVAQQGQPSTPPLPRSSPSSGPSPAATAHAPSVEDDVATATPRSTAFISTGGSTVNTEATPLSENGATTENKPKQPLALPAPGDVDPSTAGSQNKTTTVEVNGAAVTLDHLGPMIVNRDGTLARVANWPEMTEHERMMTLRVLGKRNQLRLANLREGQGEKKE